MAPYSMDLRQRVARAWDARMDAETVAGKYDVSRAWVHRLIQRRRETGSLRSRKQQKFRHRVRHTPTNSDDLMSRPRGGSGGPGTAGHAPVRLPG